jgi:hypothetical protein
MKNYTSEKWCQAAYVDSKHKIVKNLFKKGRPVMERH